MKNPIRCDKNMSKWRPSDSVHLKKQEIVYHKVWPLITAATIPVRSNFSSNLASISRLISTIKTFRWQKPNSSFQLFMNAWAWPFLSNTCLQLPFLGLSALMPVCVPFRSEVTPSSKLISALLPLLVSPDGPVIWRMLTYPPTRRALLVGCGLQMFQQVSGINTVMWVISSAPVT